MRGDAIDPDRARSWADLAVDQLEQGGFAGPTGADQKCEFTRLHRQVDVIERKARSIRSSHTGELEDRAQYTGDNVEFAGSLSLQR